MTTLAPVPSLAPALALAYASAANVINIEADRPQFTARSISAIALTISITKEAQAKAQIAIVAGAAAVQVAAGALGFDTKANLDAPTVNAAFVDTTAAIGTNNIKSPEYYAKVQILNDVSANIRSSATSSYINAFTKTFSEIYLSTGGQYYGATYRDILGALNPYIIKLGTIYGQHFDLSMQQHQPLQLPQLISMYKDQHSSFGEDSTNGLIKMIRSSDFETIKDAFKYTKKSDDSRREIGSNLSKFTRFADKINSSVCSSINPSNTSAGANLNQIYKSLSIPDITMSDLTPPIAQVDIPDRRLDDLLKLAQLFTLESENSSYRKLIGEFADNLSTYIKHIEQEILVKSNDCNGLDPMFNKDNIAAIVNNMISSYNSDYLLNKVCKYSQKFAKVQIGGGGGDGHRSYINLTSILTEECESTGQHRWKIERNKFKQIITMMLNENKIVDILRLMKDNLHLFPAAILDEDQFDRFHVLIENYKKEKRLRL